jgi:hypothetical protein
MKKYEINNFTGLYFGLAENKISSIDDFMFKYDDKLLYKLIKNDITTWLCHFV